MFISVNTAGTLTDDEQLLWHRQFPDTDARVLTGGHQSIVVGEGEPVDSTEMSSLDGNAAGRWLVHVVHDCAGVY